MFHKTFHELNSASPQKQQNIIQKKQPAIFVGFEVNLQSFSFQSSL